MRIVMRKKASASKPFVLIFIIIGLYFMFIGFFPFAVERILACAEAFRIIRHINMEEMQVTYRDLRFAQCITAFNTVFSIMVFFASLIVLMMNVLNEFYYYTAAANAVCFIPTFICMIAVNNYFSYRRPQQFNKKGGDDSAK